MKKYLFFLFLSLALAWGSFALAQEKTPGAKTGKGFWVVESNKKTPRYSTIYFYNHQQELIYKEKVEDRRLNIARAKVQKKLNGVLETAVTAWERDRILREDQQLVLLALRE